MSPDRWENYVYMDLQIGMPKTSMTDSDKLTSQE
ncbi:hypothetical protein OROGR_001639 [Orobanche gracilis]